MNWLGKNRKVGSMILETTKAEKTPKKTGFCAPIFAILKIKRTPLLQNSQQL